MADTDDTLPAEGPPELTAPSPSLFTIIVFVLNIVAALAFGYLLVLDFGVRQAWSYAIFRDDLMLWGLPLQEEENGPSGSVATRQPVVIDADRIQQEYKARRKGNAPGKFLPVNEVVGERIRPSQLTDSVLNDLFKEVPNAKDTVRTLEEEVDRVEKGFFAKVKEAASELPGALKGDEAKRKKLGDLLLPMAPSPWQVDAVDKVIRAAKSGDLDRLLVDAGQRRVLVDVLRLLEVRRPVADREDSDEERKRVAERKALLDTSADPAVVKLEQLQDLMRQRFAEAKGALPNQRLDTESYDKRSNTAYLLFAVSKARKPFNLTDPLYPDGWKRVEVVVGLFEYGNAAQALAEALVIEQKRVFEEIVHDREGYPVKPGGKLETAPGFVVRHRAAVQRIMDLVGEIKEQEAGLERQETLLGQHKKQYEDRKEHYDDVIARLLAARVETGLHVAELRRLEQQLFRAQLDLADAARTNEELEQQLHQAERQAPRPRRKKQ